MLALLGPREALMKDFRAVEQTRDSILRLPSVKER